MRGIPHLAAADGRGPRISPAHAGNTFLRLVDWIFEKDQPRTCGEYVVGSGMMLMVIGSAPHMRGIRRYAARIHARNRISPAHAGNT